MIGKKILLIGTFVSLVSCGFGDQSISAIVEIENGVIKGVKEGYFGKQC